LFLPAALVVFGPPGADSWSNLKPMFRRAAGCFKR
jgi:hypothetical protein